MVDGDTAAFGIEREGLWTAVGLHAVRVDEGDALEGDVVGMYHHGGSLVDGDGFRTATLLVVDDEHLVHPFSDEAQTALVLGYEDVLLVGSRLDEDEVLTEIIVGYRIDGRLYGCEIFAAVGRHDSIVYPVVSKNLCCNT